MAPKTGRDNKKKVTDVNGLLLEAFQCNQGHAVGRAVDLAGKLLVHIHLAAFLRQRVQIQALLSHRR